MSDFYRRIYAILIIWRIIFRPYLKALNTVRSLAPDLSRKTKVCEDDRKEKDVFDRVHISREGVGQCKQGGLVTTTANIWIMLKSFWRA